MIYPTHPLDYIDDTTTSLAVINADKALNPLRKVRAARAQSQRYLDLRHAGDDPLNRWWRAYSAWWLTAAIYVDRLDDDRARIILDLSNIDSRWTADGPDALHALFRVSGGEDETISPTSATVVVPSSKASRVALRVGQVVRDHIEPVPATCARCREDVPAEGRCRLNLESPSIMPQYTSRVLCQICASAALVWLAGGVSATESPTIGRGRVLIDPEGSEEAIQ